MHSRDEFNSGLLDFLAASPTPFHAVANMGRLLEEHGFTELRECDAWELGPGAHYYVIRHDSSICAFRTGRQPALDNGIRMIGAHTDSPCLKVKPQPEITSHGYWQLGVEVYGGALLNPWFDRDLSLAGRISVENAAHDLEHYLIDFHRPLAVIPSLAIHLDRQANDNRKINSQTDLTPLVRLAGDRAGDFRSLLLEQLRDEYPDSDAVAVLDYDMLFYDTQPPDMIGLENQFIASARLDNLLSCYAGLQSLLAADGEQTCLLICNDHEEVGSMSGTGAQGTFLRSVLQRFVDDNESLSRLVDRSLLVSTDNAHGVHPNYADRHDGRHGPRLNGGPVIKVNANQRYASNSETSALFRLLCQGQDVPVQNFVMRNDMVCGSTIGPLTAAQIGVRTLDVGVPTFAMHSIRELAGADDGYYLHRVLHAFCNSEVIS